MARKKIKPIVRVKFDQVGAKGVSLGKLEDGKVVMASGVVPGDVADVRLLKNKKRYAEGVVTEMIEYSSLRINPKCTHFEACGGCTWQNLAYSDQLQFKQREVMDSMTRLGHVTFQESRAILPSPEIFYYRNKLEFSFGTFPWLTREQIDSGVDFGPTALGFHAPGRWDKVLDIERCWLQHDFSNTLRNRAKSLAIQHQLEFHNPREKTGDIRQMMIRSASNDQWLVAFQFGNWNANVQEFMSDFSAEFPTITSLQYTINTKLNDSWYDLDLIVYRGEDHIVENLPLLPPNERELTFKIGVKSFFQTNPAQAVHLYHTALSVANLNAEQTVYDLYSGTGTIAQLIAPLVKRVVGIESVPEAVDAAINSAKQNHIANAFFEVGDMAKIFNSSFFERHEKPDVVVTDPPRSGMHPAVTAALLELAPETIVYISCNPATQARDLGILQEKYEMVVMQPVDMFPHTHHVENIALLKRKPTS